MNEAQIHRAVVQHLEAYAKSSVLWFHVPNSGFRSGRYGMALKRLGMVAGASDLVLVYRGTPFFLELKAPSGRLSRAQDIFLTKAREAGAQAAVTYGLDDALRALRMWELLR